MRTPHIIASGLLGLSLLASLAFAEPEQPSQPTPATEAAEAAILKQLQQTVTLEYQETLLEVVLDELGTKTGTNIVVNWKELENEGINKDHTVTQKLKDVSGETALIILLKPLGLTWIVQDEVIQVTTLSQASDVDHYGVLRVYDVTNLLRLAKAAGKPAATQPAAVPQPAAAQFNIPPALKQTGKIVPGQFGGFGHQFNPQLTQPVSEESWLIEAVQTSVSSPEGTWMDIDGSGGTITLVGQSLVVHQSYQTQRKIAALLQGLEAVYAQPPTAKPLLVGSRGSYPLQQDAQILADLNKPADLQAVDMPLNEVLEVIATQLGHQVLLDLKALTDEGIQPEEPVSVKLKGVTLHSALKIILSRIGLVHTVWEGTLFITTKSADNNMDYARLAVCHVGHQPQKVLDQLVDSLQENTAVAWYDLDGEGGTLSTCPGGVLVIKQSERGIDSVARQLAQVFSRLQPTKPPAAPIEAEKPDADGMVTRYYRFPDPLLCQQLQKSLPEFVAPAEWNKKNGAAIQLFGSLLVIRQTPVMHQQISTWLTRLAQHVDMIPTPPTSEFQGLQFEFVPNPNGNGFHGILNNGGFLGGSGFFSVD